MKKPASIELKDYEYSLPDSRIARYPFAQRDSSRLLIYKDRKISETSFFHLPALFDDTYQLIFNETRVVHSRLKFKKSSGADIEIFCLEPVNPCDYSLSFSSRNWVEWKCLIGNHKKWKEGTLTKSVNHAGNSFTLRAEKMNLMEGKSIVRFSWDPSGLCFSEVLELSGEMPIPPYLKREVNPIDSVAYQTIYSKNEGSVAAPTAGLHFTEEVLRDLVEKKVELLNLTLHVGAGTFLPVKEDNAVYHPMHREKIIIGRKVLQSILNKKKYSVAVGTTSCRSLESLYWLGVKQLTQKPVTSGFHLAQWEPYELPFNYSRQDALNALLTYLIREGRDSLEASTELMISPGYEFKMTDVLITNFHQPGSTLLMLVSAFIGDKARKQVYTYALKNDFRFLSYGDSSILFP